MQVGRIKLPHDPPAKLIPNPEGKVYFITICTIPRNENQLATAAAWETLINTITVRESRGDLKSKLVLAMPDHVHALWSFPGSKGMKQVVTAIKSWMATQAHVRWQRDFFDHRLRNWESASEKANYIQMNPVRAGLVTQPNDWPYIR